MKIELFNSRGTRMVSVVTKWNSYDFFITDSSHYNLKWNPRYEQQCNQEGIVFGVRFWRFGFSVIWARADECFDGGMGHFYGDVRKSLR